MIIPAVMTIAGIGLVLGVGLVLASKYLAVDEDPRLEQVTDELPGANCGGCGYAGCAGFAKAVVDDEASVNDCAPMNGDAAAVIAQLLGIELQEKTKETALVLCAGGNEMATRKSEYAGVSDCRAAELVAGADKLCPYGCLGFGTCRDVCPFGAVIITGDRLAIIDPDKCTACGKCVEACPRSIIKIVPGDFPVHVLCSSRDKGKVVKGYCKVGCIACKLCSRESKDAFDTKSGLSIVNYDFDGELPETAALVCAPQTIVDTRSFDLRTFVTDASVREAFATSQAEYKEEQKKLKAAKKAKKEAAKKKAAEKKAEKAEAEATADKAEATADKAEAEVEKAEAKVEKAEAKVEKAEAEIEKAEAKVEKAEEKEKKKKPSADEGEAADQAGGES